MNEKKVMLTLEGVKKLEEELEYLKIERRREIAEMIKEARSLGDLSENAEYDAAKEEQANAEARIQNIEKMLRNVEVIEKTQETDDGLQVGSSVTLLDYEYNEELSFTIVGAAETDPAKGLISNESPLGKALLGNNVSDIIFVDAPEGQIKYKILSIT